MSLALSYVTTYRVSMRTDHDAEIAASVAAHAELGPGYDTAIAEGLVERIGAEIDRRVDARLGRPAPAPAPAAPPAPAPAAVPARPPAQRMGFGTVVLALGSMGLGVGATAIATTQGKNAAAQFAMVLLIWAAIAVVNVVNARHRS